MPRKKIFKKQLESEMTFNKENHPKVSRKNCKNSSKNHPEKIFESFKKCQIFEMSKKREKKVASSLPKPIIS